MAFLANGQATFREDPQVLLAAAFREGPQVLLAAAFREGPQVLLAAALSSHAKGKCYLSSGVLLVLHVV